ADDAAFRRRIGGLPDLSLVRRDRRGIDDDAALTRRRRLVVHHRGGREPRHVERSDQVGLDDARELVERHRPVAADDPRRGADAGGVDEAGEGAELLDGGGDGLLDVGLARDVGADEARARPEPRGRRPARGLVDVGDDHAAAGRDDHFSGGAPETRRTARDQHGLVLQSHAPILAGRLGQVCRPGPATPLKPRCCGPGGDLLVVFRGDGVEPREQRPEAALIGIEEPPLVLHRLDLVLRAAPWSGRGRHRRLRGHLHRDGHRHVHGGRGAVAVGRGHRDHLRHLDRLRRRHRLRHERLRHRRLLHGLLRRGPLHVLVTVRAPAIAPARTRRRQRRQQLGVRWRLRVRRRQRFARSRRRWRYRRGWRNRDDWFNDDDWHGRLDRRHRGRPRSGYGRSASNGRDGFNRLNRLSGLKRLNSLNTRRGFNGCWSCESFDRFGGCDRCDPRDWCSSLNRFDELIGGLYGFTGFIGFIGFVGFNAFPGDIGFDRFEALNRLYRHIRRNRLYGLVRRN